MSNTSIGPSLGKSGRSVDRREDDRRAAQAEFVGEDRRAGERRSGEDRRQAPRVRL